MQLLPLDFILAFCQGIIPDNGEDSYCYSFCDTAGLLGAFDGCGGAGARKHDFYSGKTEAYIASRLCAGAFFDTFHATFPCNLSADQVAKEVFFPQTINLLKTWAPPQTEEAQGVRSSLVRTLPTTAAVAMVQATEDDSLLVSAIWAGDSRVYLLDAKGLSQLTKDDTSVPDPMDSSYEDGVLRNIFCCDRPVRLNCKTFRIKPPFTVFAASDGCFGYVRTPMEFEGILLHSLLRSNCAAQWEQQLCDIIGQFAGDDHTLSLAAFGYGTFPALQESLRPRYDHIFRAYLKPLQAIPPEDRQSRYALWEKYRSGYMRYLEVNPTQ